VPRKLGTTHCKRGHLIIEENRTDKGRCKPCEVARVAEWQKAHSEEHLASCKRYAENYKEKKKDNELRSRYGISIEERDSLVLAQGGRCPICMRDLKGTKISVDHDHACCPGSMTCGKCIRAVLCQRCNVLLGLAKDSSEILNNAIQYLKETQCNQNLSSEPKVIAQTATA